MSEKKMHNDIEILLTVMRKMNHAALQAEWAELEHLDNQRHSILEALSQSAWVPTQECIETIVELTRLDQSVLAVTNQSLERVANKVEITKRQSQACQQYEAFSGTQPAK